MKKTIEEVLKPILSLKTRGDVADFLDDEDLSDGYYIGPIMEYDELSGVEVKCGNITINTAEDEIYNRIDKETIKVSELPPSDAWTALYLYIQSEIE